MKVWLYHINPKSVYGYKYGWAIERPASILRSSDRTWSSLGSGGRLRPGDLICVYMKNIGDKPDGVHIVGVVNSVDRQNAEFTWRPDRKRSGRTLVYPITSDVIRRFFPRSFGSSIQLLDDRKQASWLRLIGRGDETDAVPRVRLRRGPAEPTLPTVDPQKLLEHGRIGEKHVMKILRGEYPPREGYNVTQVSAGEPGADHDIAVTRNGRLVRLVEVKTRSGKAGDPVPISERQIALRKRHRGRHSFYIVYLLPKGIIREVTVIGDKDAYTLMPLQHWLHPGQP